MDAVARVVAELFARQDGVATARQLEALGATRGHVRHRVASGEWVRLSRNVIGSVATPDSWRRCVRAAWLDAGTDTAVSHVTGGRLHRFDGLDAETEIHLTSCGGRHRTSLADVTVHRSQLLRAADCAEVDGIRVVTRPVALVQIAGSRGADAAAQALDGMLRAGDAATWIERAAQAWLKPGVGGAAIVLDLLRERTDRRLPRSWFQRVAKRLLQTRALVLVDELPVRDPDDGRLLAELDLAHPELKIGIECQSWRWHGTPTAQVRDAARKRRLRLLGWEIVDVWWADLRRIDAVVEELQFLVDRRTPVKVP